MKKVTLIIALIATCCSFVQAQENMDTITFEVHASASISNMNLSVPTGILFDPHYALEIDANGSIKYKNIAFSVNYGGHATIGGRMFNLSDLSVTYSVSENIALTAGYEFIYIQHPTEESSTSHAVFGTAALKKNKLSMVGIAFYNIPDNFVYLILSSDYKVSDKINLHGVVGYTTGEPNPIYGLVGPQFLSKKASIGTYVTLRKNATGFMVELKASLF